MTDLEKTRKEIDKIDEKIIHLLKQRKEKVLKVKKIKIKLKKPIKDIDREKIILEKAKSSYEKEIFKQILTQSKKIQNPEK